MILNLIALGLGLWVFMACFDRLRQITWRIARPTFVLLYLLMTVWAAGVVMDSFVGSVELYQLAGVIGSLVWIVMTHAKWKRGIPEYVAAIPDEDRRIADRRAAK